MTLRVGVNLLWLVPGVVGGSEEATVAILGGVLDADTDVDLRLYGLTALGRAHPELTGRCPVRLIGLYGGVKPLRVGAEATWLAAVARRDGLDLIHHAGGVLPPTSPSPSVLTVHDLQPLDLPDNFSRAKVAYLRAVLPRSVRRATLVVTPSRASADRVVERFGVPEDRVRVVPHGLGPEQFVPPSADRIDSVRRAHGIGERWITYPVITYPHKNHLTLIEAFGRLAHEHHDLELVLTGGAGPFEGEVHRAIDASGAADRIHRTGRIARTDLDALVAGALALAFPSRYEGFGLGALEAMAFGVPVVAASAGSLPEVVAGAGVLVDPDDVDGWAAALVRLADDEDHRRALSEAGRERAADFTVAASAAGLVGAYRDAAR